MIKHFKIHSNYLIEGTNVKVSWKTSGALFVKLHTDSLKKGWYKKNDKIQINLSTDLKKITLYAFGLTRIEKKEIIIQFNKQKEILQENKKIKNIDIKSNVQPLKTLTNFNARNLINNIKPTYFSIKTKEKKSKINYSNLNINDHG
jgi:hypothetical protein